MIADNAGSLTTAGRSVSLYADDEINFTASDNAQFMHGSAGDTLNIGAGWAVDNSTSADFTRYTHQPSIDNLVRLSMDDHVTVTSS